MVDVNVRPYENGHIIDIHQTVNGHNLFYIESLKPLVIRYFVDGKPDRIYEYEMIDLLVDPNYFLTETEIIGKYNGTL